LQPQIVELKPLDRGGVQTVTTVDVRHEKLVPAGVFEYQHSTGDNLKDAVSKGFDAWASLDLAVFADALKAKPETCTTLEYSFPAKPPLGERRRRVVLGPTAHAAAWPAVAENEEHPFCPCCLLTNSFEPFRALIENDSSFYGIRLFASRDQDGKAQADCRVNGEDWGAGAAALAEYVKKWPNRGFEYRKQYIAIQST
jgi:Family of unknown function (DUF6348)